MKQRNVLSRKFTKDWQKKNRENNNITKQSLFYTFKTIAGVLLQSEI